jgi:hypothetical protein
MCRVAQNNPHVGAFTRLRCLVAVLCAINRLTVDAFGLITSQTESQFSRSSPTSDAGAVCMLHDVDTDLCLRMWSAPGQPIPTHKAFYSQFFAIGAETYLAIANYFNGSSYNVGSIVLR